MSTHVEFGFLKGKGGGKHSKSQSVGNQAVLDPLLEGMDNQVNALKGGEYVVRAYGEMVGVNVVQALPVQVFYPLHFLKRLS